MPAGGPDVKSCRGSSKVSLEGYSTEYIVEDGESTISRSTEMAGVEWDEAIL